MALPRGSNALLALLLVLLVGGLAVLATLQYRWIDRVSEAERQRMRANLDFSSRRFADELRREIEPLIAPFDVAEAATFRRDTRVGKRARKTASGHGRLSCEPGLRIVGPAEGGSRQRASRRNEMARSGDAPSPARRPDGRRPRMPGPFISEIPALFIPHRPRTGRPPLPSDREPPPPDGGPPRPDAERPTSALR